jgi:transposase-like protein
VKYSATLTARICAILSTGEHTIADVCQQVGISEAVFYHWKAEKVEFLESLKKAEQTRLAAFATMARSGLAKLLDVYEVEEEALEYVDNGKGQPKIKSRKVTRRTIMPNPTAILFTLKNREPAQWQDKQQHELTGKDGTPLPLPQIRVYTGAPPLSSSEKEVAVDV